MIEFTIKTLDANDHHFSVDDEITVQQLKEKVMEQMGVEISLQRLIFCGRVLQDEKKLSEYGVHGKVVHMVQRAPPSAETRRVAYRQESSNNEDGNVHPFILNNIHHFTHQPIRRLMAIPSQHGEEEMPEILSPTTKRMQFLRRLITEIKSTLEAIKMNEREDSHQDAVEDCLESTSGYSFGRSFQDADDFGPESSQGRRRGNRPVNTTRSTPRELGTLMSELHELEQAYAPYRQSYIAALRDTEQQMKMLPDDIVQRRQRTADLAAELHHSFAHAYHLISDISLLVINGNWRLTSESFLRHPIQLPAHINVVQSNRRTANATSANNNSTQAASSENQAQGSNAQAGRNTTQPTVNINIQPDPITYQVEIETRVPIQYSIETAFLNGVNATGQGEPNQAQNQGQNQNAQNQNGQNQNATNQNVQNQQNQDGQTQNRSQVMLDFENLFRGLGQAGSLGGVEVVMSMEEIPQGGALGNLVGQANNNNSTSNSTQQGEGGEGGPGTVFGSQIYLAQMPWGGAPSADMLQNIVTSLMRQGFVPGVEGILQAQLQNQGQNQNLGQNQNQGQGQNQGPNQNQSQSQNQGQGQIIAPSQVQSQVRSQAPSQVQSQAQSQAPSQVQSQVQSQAPSQAPSQVQSQTQSQAQSQAINQASNETLNQAQNQAQNPSQSPAQTPPAQTPGQIPAQIPAQTSAQSPAQTPAQTPAQNQAQNQEQQNQGQPQNQQAEGQTQEQPERPEQPQSQVQGQTQNINEEQLPSYEEAEHGRPHIQISQGQTQNVTSGDQIPSSQSQSFQFRRAPQPRSRSQTFLLSNIVYDRFLTCDSAHARRQLARRREENQQTSGSRNRSGFSRMENNVNALFEHFDSSSSHPENLLIASMIILREATSFTSGRTLQPQDFAPLRQTMYEYVRELLDDNYDLGAYELVADRLFERNAELIDRILGITPMRPNIDVVASLKAVFVRFLDEAMTVLNLENTEMVCRRFRIVFTRLFFELCGVISYACVEGSDGLRLIYRSVLNELLEYVGLPVRDLLHSLAMENLESTVNRIAAKRFHNNQFIRRKEVQASGSTMDTEEAMDVSSTTPPPAEPPCERMDTSPVRSAPNSMSTSTPNRTQSSHPHRARARVNRSPRTSQPTSPDPLVRFVPPATIAQHWGEDWVPTFTRDIQEQNDSVEPYSDAYLSGMPPKKRRCVRQSRPPTTLDGFMNESVHEASEHVGTTQNESLRAAFREHMRSMTRMRATSSDDYDPRRYVATARFLSQARRDSQRSPQNNGE